MITAGDGEMYSVTGMGAASIITGVETYSTIRAEAAQSAKAGEISSTTGAGAT